MSDDFGQLLKKNVAVLPAFFILFYFHLFICILDPCACKGDSFICITRRLVGRDAIVFDDIKTRVLYASNYPPRRRLVIVHERAL